MTAAPALVAVFVDESCLGNGREGDNPGAAAGVIELPPAAKDPRPRLDFWLSEPATTNNRMAIRSAIAALGIIAAMPGELGIIFTSDSKYLVDGMRDWVPGWIRRGWRRKEGPIKNLPLWQELAAASRTMRIDWRWVRGHEGHPQNEYANFLAVRAATQLDQSRGAVPSEFDVWYAAERAKGRVRAAPDALPDAHTFRPAPPLPPEPAASLFG